MTLKILTLLAAFLLAIVAIRGNTWNEDEKNIFKKVTAPGWLSIFFLILSLVFGIASEIQSSKENNRSQQRLDDALSTISEKVDENASQADMIKTLSKSKEFSIVSSKRIPVSIPISEQKPAVITLLEYDGPIDLFVTSKSGVKKVYTALPAESPKTYVFRWSDVTILSAIRKDFHTKDIPLDRFGRRINRFGIDEDVIVPPVIDFDNLDGYRDVTLNFIKIELGANRDVRGKYYVE